MTWKPLVGAIALLLAIGGAYWFGRGDGLAIEKGKQAAVERAIAEERAKREEHVDQVGAGAVQVEAARTNTMTEVRHEIERITVDRPVYRNVCIDADGVRALDRAAAAANGEDPGIRPAAAGEDPGGAPPG
jgi:hypothetical protein